MHCFLLRGYIFKTGIQDAQMYPKDAFCTQKITALFDSHFYSLAANAGKFHYSVVLWQEYKIQSIQKHLPRPLPLLPEPGQQLGYEAVANWKKILGNDMQIASN